MMTKSIFFILCLGLVSAATSQLLVREGSNTYLKVEKSTGNVAIGLGEQAATAKLDVAGNIRFRGLVQGTLNHPVLAVDADGNLSVVEDRHGSGADGVVTEAAFSGTSSKILTLTLSDASTVTATFSDLNEDADHVIGNEYQDLGSTKTNDDVTVTISDGTPTTFSVRDQDHDPNNEKPVGGSAIDISGTDSRMVSVRVDDATIKINPYNNTLRATNTWNWSFPNIEYEPINLDVSTAEHGFIEFDIGGHPSVTPNSVSGYTSAFFTMAGTSDGGPEDYFYLVKEENQDWETHQCGGVTLDFDDATIMAPVYEDPSTPGKYKVYFDVRDQGTADLENIQLYIGLVGLAR
jgi:hypothetical protein